MSELTEQEFQKIMKAVYESITPKYDKYDPKINVLLGDLKPWEFTEMLRKKREEGGE